jgi:hypothetical protein
MTRRIIIEARLLSLQVLTMRPGQTKMITCRNHKLREIIRFHRHSAQPELGAQRFRFRSVLRRPVIDRFFS